MLICPYHTPTQHTNDAGDALCVGTCVLSADRFTAWPLRKGVYTHSTHHPTTPGAHDAGDAVVVASCGQFRRK